MLEKLVVDHFLLEELHAGAGDKSEESCARTNGLFRFLVSTAKTDLGALTMALGQGLLEE